MTDFTGRWFTTFGRMDLEQSGSRVQGAYHLAENVRCEIQGTVKDGVLEFRYREPHAAGNGWFRLTRYGKFSGRWKADQSDDGGFWQGHRGFDGVWQTSYGLVCLIEEEDRILGFYEQAKGASLQGGKPAGKSNHHRLDFQFQEARSRGDGFFQLDECGLSFEGKRRRGSGGSWQPWHGRRVCPRPGLRWLVVFEAHWQRLLQERNYSLGGMLREFFARVPPVEVSHRFFASETDLATWCREILYIPEPVTLVVATHGSRRGLKGHSGTIPLDALVEHLRYADNVNLLHFSSCYAENGSNGGFGPSLCGRVPFPVSGYAQRANWAATALIDFTYLDLILAQNQTPEQAAKQVPQLRGSAEM